MYIESQNLELKVKYTDNIVREIVAFLNSEGGIILIGVKDDGEIVGVNNIDEIFRKLADDITTKIEPNPVDEVRAEIKFDKGKSLIAININKGNRSIYCIKKYVFSSVGYPIRIGTTCREMAPEQIRIRYEENFIDSEYMLKKPSSLKDLTFREFRIYYSEKGYHLEDDSYKINFNMLTKDQEYNLLAELLADKNNIPLIFVKFNGQTKASISQRNDYGYGCILTTYFKIKNRLEAENICFSNTTVRPRKDKYLFDFDCVNEALINALIHNDWTISEPQISIFSDRLEILSHGGLPKGMSEEDFLKA